MPTDADDATGASSNGDSIENSNINVTASVSPATTTTATTATTATTTTATTTTATTATTTTTTTTTEEDTRPIYAYPDILRGNDHCLLDANYPAFMSLPNNADIFLFDSVAECCESYKYTCTTDEPTLGPISRPTGVPTVAPTTASPMTASPMTASPMTALPMTASPMTASPMTGAPTTAAPTTAAPMAAPTSTAIPTSELILLPETESREEDSNSSPPVNTTLQEPDTSPSSPTLPTTTSLTVEEITSNDPSLSPSAYNNTSIKNSHLLVGASEKPNPEVQSNDDAAVNPLLFLGVMAPLILLVLASMWFKVIRKREASWDDDYEEDSYGDYPEDYIDDEDYDDDYDDDGYNDDGYTSVNSKSYARTEHDEENPRTVLNRNTSSPSPSPSSQLPNDDFEEDFGGMCHATMEHHSGEFSVHTEEHLIDEGQGCLCRIDYDDIPNHDHHREHRRDRRHRNRNRNDDIDVDSDTDTTDDDDIDDINFASANINLCISNDLMEDSNAGGIEQTFSVANQLRSREKRGAAAAAARRGGRGKREEGEFEDHNDPKDYANYGSYSREEGELREGSFSRSECSSASSGGVSCDDTFVGGGREGLEIGYDGNTNSEKK